MKIQSAIVILALEFGLLMASVSLCSAQNPLTAVLKRPLQPQTSPAVAHAPPASSAPGLAGKVTKISGNVTVARGGATGPLKVGDPIYKGDQIFTDCKSSVFVLFTDNTIQLKLAEATEMTIDEYVYNPNSNWHNKIRFSLQKGSFEYINGVIGRPEEQDVQIDTPLGAIVDRGTYFICEYDGKAKTLQIYVSIGEVDFHPAGGAEKPVASGQGPVWVKIAPPPALGMFGTWVLALTQPQYAVIEAELFSAQSSPTSVCAPCPKAANAKGPVLNITFTSYTTAITNEDLCNVFQGLYQAGLDSSGNAIPKGFAARMDSIAKTGAIIGLFVLDGDKNDKYDYSGFQTLGKKAYLNGKNAEANLKKGQAPNASTSIQVPNPDEFVMAIESQPGAFEVVISLQALEWGYYLPCPTSNPCEPGDTMVPSTYPIQMPMAYELGTNIFNLVTNPNWCEELVEADTNQFVLKAFPFPIFHPNSDQETGSAFYGNLPPPAGTIPKFTLREHGVYDLRNSSVIPAAHPSGSDVIPKGSFNNISGKEGGLFQPYVGLSIAPPPPPPPLTPSEKVCTPKPPSPI